MPCANVRTGQAVAPSLPAPRPYACSDGMARPASAAYAPRLTMRHSLPAHECSELAAARVCATAERHCRRCGTSLHGAETNPAEPDSPSTDRAVVVPPSPMPDTVRTASTGPRGRRAARAPARSDMRAGMQGAHSVSTSARAASPGTVREAPGATETSREQEHLSAPGALPDKDAGGGLYMFCLTICSARPSGPGCGLPYWRDKPHATRHTPPFRSLAGECAWKRSPFA